MKKAEETTNIKKIITHILAICIFVCIMECGLCSEEITDPSNETEMPLMPLDNYAEIEAQIQQMSEELTHKNMHVARNAQGIVQNPGIIKGRVLVTTGHSGTPERHSENTIVFIDEVNGNNYAPPQQKQVLHSGYIAFTKGKWLPPEAPIMDQWNVEFIPHVLPVLKGSIVDFPNTDSVRHNVYSPVPIPGTEIMLSLGTYDPDIIKTIRLDKPGETPLRCNVHQEMSAFIVVLDNPYFTVTNKSGEFTIDNVPPREYTLKTWHENLKPVSADVSVGPGQAIAVNLPNISEKR